MDTSVKASCNWNLSSGCELAKAIQTTITHEDIFMKPALDDIIHEDRAVLLTKAGDEASCEMQLKVFPRYKIESLSLVCSAPKLEWFCGGEYVETVYGAILADNEARNELPAGEMTIPSTYRYDIEVERSGVVEVSLKLLPAATELCIFGILIQIAPNPNGITTLLPTAINLENVQKILNSSNAKLSPNAEKCKLFMQMYNKSQVANQQRTASALLPTPAEASSAASLLEQMRLTLGASNASAANASQTLDNILKAHIDGRLQQLENKLMDRLNALESQQNEKLDSIIKLLQNANTV